MDKPRPQPRDGTVGPDQTSAAEDSDFTLSQEAPDAAQAVGSRNTPAGGLHATQALEKDAPRPRNDGTQELNAPSGKASSSDKPTQVAAAENAPVAKETSGGGEKVTTIGDFKITKLLGKGGMGAVYLAVEISIERPCALKVMKKELAANKNFAERFKREARIQCNLDHPNIVRGYRVAEERGLNLFAMEYVDGGSIQGYLKKLGQFNVGDALHITLAVLNAMEYAHENNMIHRDIKPDNIMVTSKGVVKVADLGLAKATDEDMSLTQSGLGAGTPYYMSPEQAANAKHVDRRTDIYAIGCMAYAFLTGEMPFKGNTTLELIKAKEEGKFDSIRKYNMNVPEKLDLIVSKMIQKRPEHRFQSCAEAIAALQELNLANPTLSFIPGATGAIPGSAPTPTKTPAVRSRPTVKPPAEPLKEVPKQQEDWWYIRYTDEEDEKVSRRVTTAQLHELIRLNQIDRRAEARRNFKDEFRPLATFREFSTALQARGMQAKADRRMEKVKNFYQNIEEENRKYKRWKGIKKLFNSAFGLITLLMMLAAIAGLGYVAWAYGTPLLKAVGINLTAPPSQDPQ